MALSSIRGPSGRRGPSDIEKINAVVQLTGNILNTALAVPKFIQEREGQKKLEDLRERGAKIDQDRFTASVAEKFEEVRPDVVETPTGGVASTDLRAPAQKFSVAGAQPEPFSVSGQTPPGVFRSPEARIETQRPEGAVEFESLPGRFFVPKEATKLDEVLKGLRIQDLGNKLAPLTESQKQDWQRLFPERPLPANNSEYVRRLKDESMIERQEKALKTAEETRNFVRNKAERDRLEKQFDKTSKEELDSINAVSGATNVIDTPSQVAQFGLARILAKGIFGEAGRLTDQDVFQFVPRSFVGDLTRLKNYLLGVDRRTLAPDQISQMRKLLSNVLTAKRISVGSKAHDFIRQAEESPQFASSEMGQQWLRNMKRSYGDTALAKEIRSAYRDLATAEDAGSEKWMALRDGIRIMEKQYLRTLE